MPTNHDWYEALNEGRWQPEIETGIGGEGNKSYFYARYKQGEEVVEVKSNFDPMDAENNLMQELRQGTLEGKYYPQG
jgi:hypothetical protein